MNVYSATSSRSIHSCSRLQHGCHEHMAADAIMSMQLLMPLLSIIMNMSPTVLIRYARMLSRFKSAVLNPRLHS